MTMSESAQIIQFPAGGRAGFRKPREEMKSADAAIRVPKISFGGSWYHEEAVREAEQTRNI